MTTSPSPSRQRFSLPFGRRDGTTEPPFDPRSWSGALILIGIVTAVLWAMQIANVADHYGLNRFGVRPRAVSGLWGVLMQPLLHQSWAHLGSNTLPLVAIGWTLMLSGWRVFLFVTVAVVLAGGFLTWLIAPSGQLIVGASGMIFGWLGYLIARAAFTRRIKYIFPAVALLVVFGTLLSSLLPTVDTSVSWQSHLSGFVAGLGVGWLLHPRRQSKAQLRANARAARRTGGPAAP